VSFYASALCLTPDSFSKKIKTLLGKTPNKLIQERVVLEAKKLLHLTYKSIKEVAFELNFEDEFYFSRFFKKNVKNRIWLRGQWNKRKEFVFLPPRPLGVKQLHYG